MQRPGCRSPCRQRPRPCRARNTAVFRALQWHPGVLQWQILFALPALPLQICPLCINELDETEKAWLPCSCGWVPGLPPTDY